MLRTAVSNLIKVKSLIEKEEELLRYFITQYTQTGKIEFLKKVEAIEAKIDILKNDFETLDKSFPRNRT